MEQTERNMRLSDRHFSWHKYVEGFLEYHQLVDDGRFRKSKKGKRIQLIHILNEIRAFYPDNYEKIIAEFNSRFDELIAAYNLTKKEIKEIRSIIVESSNLSYVMEDVVNQGLYTLKQRDCLMTDIRSIITRLEDNEDVIEYHTDIKIKKLVTSLRKIEELDQDLIQEQAVGLNRVNYQQSNLELFEGYVLIEYIVTKGKSETGLSGLIKRIRQDIRCLHNLLYPFDKFENSRRLSDGIRKWKDIIHTT
jgi:hypothetical protein